MGLFFSGVDTDYFLFFYSGSIFFLTDFMNARRIWLEPKELSKNMLRIFGRAPARIQSLGFGIDDGMEPLQHFSRPGEIQREG